MTIPPDFESEHPTQPIPVETLAEVTERWRADQAAGIPIGERPAHERVTRNLRPVRP